MNEQCPRGDCDSGWKPGACSESIFKLFLLWNWTLWLINIILMDLNMNTNLSKINETPNVMVLLRDIPYMHCFILTKMIKN